ncbi:hypothetical protein [Amycolatopsis sp. NPDC051128]|uniref:hypothetical protein n=1 Tax=Amycolatopsis sp. NPDC051128 TaxID=3155412 RepID=UPI00343EFCCE
MHASPRRIRRSGIVAATAMILLGGVAAVTTTAAVAATVDTSAWSMSWTDTAA